MESQLCSLASAASCSSTAFRAAIPILDRIIAVLTGSPDDPTWSNMHLTAAQLLEESWSQLPAPSARKEQMQAQRGDFTAAAAGQSMGGGQKVSSCFTLLPGLKPFF